MINPIIEQKFDIVCKNFYNDLYDIIENNNLDDYDSLALLTASFSTVLINTFRTDTPKILTIIKKHYNEIAKDPETKKLLEEEE